MREIEEILSGLKDKAFEILPLNELINIPVMNMAELKISEVKRTGGPHDTGSHVE